MPAFKDGNKWKVGFRYRDFTGKLRQVTRRGFSTKREALNWEREFFFQEESNPDMTFSSLVSLYLEDMENRLKKNTMITKKTIIEYKILPYFENVKINDITPMSIRKWQNILMNKIGSHGQPFSQTYLKTINNQMSAILNYAVRYHNLKSNPVRLAGSMGKKHATEMEIWTPEEFLTFVKLLENKTVSYVAFNILFWTGIRIGELLALTIADFNYNQKTLRINKSYQRLEGEDVVTVPKTPKSNRVIVLGDDLAELINDYIKMFYRPVPKLRLFHYTKHAFENDMNTYSKKAGVKKIRLHDLRHSHASYLFNHGVDIITISRRLGHENIETTLSTYAHTYKSADKFLINVLNSDIKKDPSKL